MLAAAACRVGSGGIGLRSVCGGGHGSDPRIYTGAHRRLLLQLHVRGAAPVRIHSIGDLRHVLRRTARASASCLARPQFWDTGLTAAERWGVELQLRPRPMYVLVRVDRTTGSAVIKWNFSPSLASTLAASPPFHAYELAQFRATLVLKSRMPEGFCIVPRPTLQQLRLPTGQATQMAGRAPPWRRCRWAGGRPPPALQAW